MKSTVFGKTIESYFEKDCNTSWIIDSLEQHNLEGYYYDTLTLLRVFHLHLSNKGQHACYAVSIHAKRSEDCAKTAIDTKLTLSKIKQLYADQYFDSEKVTDNVIISALISDLSSFDWEKIEQDVILKTPLSFKAQAANGPTRGKTKTYCIIGFSLKKVR